MQSELSQTPSWYASKTDPSGLSEYGKVFSIYQQYFGYKIAAYAAFETDVPALVANGELRPYGKAMKSLFPNFDSLSYQTPPVLSQGYPRMAIPTHSAIEVAKYAHASRNSGASSVLPSASDPQLQSARGGNSSLSLDVKADRKASPLKASEVTSSAMVDAVRPAGIGNYSMGAPGAGEAIEVRPAVRLPPPSQLSLSPRRPLSRHHSVPVIRGVMEAYLFLKAGGALRDDDGKMLLYKRGTWRGLIARMVGALFNVVLSARQVTNIVEHRTKLLRSLTRKEKRRQKLADAVKRAGGSTAAVFTSASSTSTNTNTSTSMSASTSAVLGENTVGIADTSIVSQGKQPSLLMHRTSSGISGFARTGIGGASRPGIALALSPRESPYDGDIDRMPWLTPSIRHNYDICSTHGTGRVKAVAPISYGREVALPVHPVGEAWTSSRMGILPDAALPQEEDDREEDDAIDASGSGSSAADAPRLSADSSHSELKLPRVEQQSSSTVAPARAVVEAGADAGTDAGTGIASNATGGVEGGTGAVVEAGTGAGAGAGAAFGTPTGSSAIISEDALAMAAAEAAAEAAALSIQEGAIYVAGMASGESDQFLERYHANGQARMQADALLNVSPMPVLSSNSHLYSVQALGSKDVGAVGHRASTEAARARAVDYAWLELLARGPPVSNLGLLSISGSPLSAETEVKALRAAEWLAEDLCPWCTQSRGNDDAGVPATLELPTSGPTGSSSQAKIGQKRKERISTPAPELEQHLGLNHDAMVKTEEMASMARAILTEYSDADAGGVAGSASARARLLLLYPIAESCREAVISLQVPLAMSFIVNGAWPRARALVGLAERRSQETHALAADEAHGKYAASSEMIPGSEVSQGASEHRVINATASDGGDSSRTEATTSPSAPSSLQPVTPARLEVAGTGIEFNGDAGHVTGGTDAYAAIRSGSDISKVLPAESSGAIRRIVIPQSVASAQRSDLSNEAGVSHASAAADEEARLLAYSKRSSRAIASDGHSSALGSTTSMGDFYATGRFHRHEYGASEHGGDDDGEDADEGTLDGGQADGADSGRGSPHSLLGSDGVIGTMFLDPDSYSRYMRMRSDSIGSHGSIHGSHGSPVERDLGDSGSLGEASVEHGGDGIDGNDGRRGRIDRRETSHRSSSMPRGVTAAGSILRASERGSSGVLDYRGYNRQV